VSLETLWFLLLGAMMSAYAALDGFDLGVGVLSVFARRAAERSQLIEAIDPFWDGNEAWLVVFGGALFAAFPEAYATLFSGFYGALLAVLVALIVRAASLAFRNRVDSRAWQAIWDAAFFAASLITAFLFGAAVGAVLVGIPLGSDGAYHGSAFGAVVPPRLGWYPALVGALAVALFALHGALFLELRLRIDEPLRQRVRRWQRRAFIAAVALCAVVTTASFVGVPSVRAAVGRPVAWLLIAGTIAGFTAIAICVRTHRPRRAFAASMVLVFCLLGLVAVSLYPNLVISSPGGQNLTIHNSAASHTTLILLTVMAALGLPLAFAYLAILYRTFRRRIDAMAAE
jgi:cytochrome d ubiquinol oxidase subunit II